MAPPLSASLPPTCKVEVPAADTSPAQLLSRWSDAGITSAPHVIVTPSTEADIIAVIKFATSHKLRIVPIGGGHGCFVPIDSHTIYLRMHNFRSIDFDEEKREVEIGGGCLTGEILKKLAALGWYTAASSSNAVGVVGALLGGLNNGLVGLHGVAVDLVESITMIPFLMPGGKEPRVLTLDRQSTGEENHLFTALKGAGHGLGIVTSVALKAFPISSLSLTEDKIWTRQLIFDPASLPLAASTYVALVQDIPPPLSATLIFLRAPPRAPNAGAPLIMLALTYYGPSADAMKACKITYSDEVTETALSAKTIMVAFANMNDASEPMNRHGGFKENYSALVRKVSPENIEAAFTAWRKFTDKDMGSRASSYVVIGASNTDQMQQNDLKMEETLFPGRDRGVFIQATPWYEDVSDKADADIFGTAVVDAMRASDRSAENALPDRGFANNWRIGQDPLQMYTKGQIQVLEQVKSIWDKHNTGWSPAIDGW